MGLLFTDGAKSGRAEQLHFASQALYDFEALHGHLPEPYNESHIKECVELAESLNNACRTIGRVCGESACMSLNQIDEDVVRKVGLHLAMRH